MLEKLAPYRKTISAVVTGLIGWATAVLASSDSGVTGTEWIMLATILATALGVFGVPNAIAPAAKVDKAAGMADGG